MRLQGWEGRLANAIEEARELPFCWGEHDCALFSFKVVRELTGADLMAPYRGVYHGELEAAHALESLGKGTLRESVGMLLGAEIAPNFAQRGDLVLWQQPELGDTVGVCLGVQAAFVGVNGLVFAPMTQALTAWRVG